MQKSRLPRRHRRTFSDPGHDHELTLSCYLGYLFLKASRVCEWQVAAIETASVRLATDVCAFVFMPEHGHLIVHPRRAQYDIAEIRQAIEEPVGRAALLEPSTLPAMIDSLDLNPVRRGLVERAVDWHWSSAAYYECDGHSPLRLDSIPPEWLVTEGS